MFALAKDKPVKAPIKGYVVPMINDVEELMGLPFMSDAKSNYIVGAYLYAICQMTELAGAFKGGAAGQKKCKEIIAAVIANGEKHSDEDIAEFAEKLAPNANDEGLFSNVIGLLSGGKKKSYTTENIDGYYQSLGISGISTSKVCSFLNQLSPFFPSVVSNPAYGKIRYESTWQNYREDLTSWQSILERCAKDMVLMNVLDQEECDKLILIDVRLPSNINACPASVLLALATYLEAADDFPAGWKQGKKAMDQTNPKKLKTMIMAWKKYFEITSDSGNVEAAKTLGDIVKAFKSITG